MSYRCIATVGGQRPGFYTVFCGKTITPDTPTPLIGLDRAYRDILDGQPDWEMCPECRQKVAERFIGERE